MIRIFCGHDVPNWAFIAMTLLTMLLAEGFTALIDRYERLAASRDAVERGKE
jgi:hypothetical protein